MAKWAIKDLDDHGNRRKFPKEQLQSEGRIYKFFCRAIKIVGRSTPHEERREAIKVGVGKAWRQ
jgi:hypothetical protein